MTKDTTFQHASSTHPSPRKHVVGVFDSLQEGEQAVQALVDAGYHAEDIAFIPSQDVPSAFQDHSRKEGLFWRIIHRLQVTTDEGSLVLVCGAKRTNRLEKPHESNLSVFRAR